MTIIAHITTVHPLSDPRILRKECRALAQAGHEVYLVGPGRTEDEVMPVEDGVTIVKTGFVRGRLGRAIIGSLHVWTQLRRIRPKVVHGHDPELLPLLVAWRLANRGGVTIYDAHESLVGQIEGKPYIPRSFRPLVKAASWLLVKTVTQRLDGVVAATPHIQSGFSVRRTCVVQNFPWESSFPESGNELDRKNFCYVGGLSRVRGIDEMVWGLDRAGSESRLMLVGPVDEYAKAVIGRSGDKLDYLGVVDSGEIPEILERAIAGFVVLHPVENYLRSQPTKLFEYMAAGIPFIASDFPYWRDMVGNFDAGYFVDPGDIEQIASAVRAVLDYPEEARHMGARGRLAFEQHFSFASQAAALVDFVYSLTSDR